MKKRNMTISLEIREDDRMSVGIMEDVELSVAPDGGWMVRGQVGYAVFIGHGSSTHAAILNYLSVRLGLDKD